MSSGLRWWDLPRISDAELLAEWRVLPRRGDPDEDPDEDLAELDELDVYTREGEELCQ